MRNFPFQQTNPKIHFFIDRFTHLDGARYGAISPSSETRAGEQKWPASRPDASPHKRITIISSTHQLVYINWSTKITKYM